MTMNSELEALVRDLERLHSGEMSCESFRRKYLTSSSSIDFKNLPDIIGSLSHYVDDEDLRMKDEWISSMQSRELSKMINLLKNGSCEDELKKITFLGYSD